MLEKGDPELALTVERARSVLFKYLVLGLVIVFFSAGLFWFLVFDRFTGNLRLFFFGQEQLLV